MTTTVRAMIHVSPDCYINVSVDQIMTDSKKYAALTMGYAATIFINSRKKALEIAKLLEQAAQELEDEDDVPN